MTQVSSIGSSRGISRSGPLLTSLLLLAASAVMTQAALASSGVPTRAVIWGGLAMAAYAYGLLGLLLAARGPGQGLGSWRLGPWMMIWCGTMYGLATVTLSQPPTGITVEILLSSALRALWLVAAGTTMWALGYLLGPGHHARAAATRVVNLLGRRFSGDVRGPLTPWVLYGIGAVARLASAVSTSRLGYVGDAASAVSTASGYSQVLLLLGLCAPIAVAAAALQAFRQQSRGARVTLITLFLAEFGYAMASGQKENFALAVLAIAIPYSSARRRLPKTALTILAVIFLVIIIPFTQAYRNTVRDGKQTLTTMQAIDAAPGILTHTLSGQHQILSVLPNSISYLLQRGQDIDSPAIIMQRTPTQIGFSSPADLVTGPLTALIPRAIWPGKPILDTGYEFGQEYFNLPTTIYSSTTITPIGDLYRHGGWIPVIVGMFLFGCAIRLLDDVLDVRANPHATFLLILLFPSLVMSEQDWITLLAAIPAFVVLWMLTVAITFRRRPGRP